MHSLYLASLALALLRVPTTFALKIEAPSIIAAGQPVQINISTEIWNSTSLDASFDTYKLYLTASQNDTAYLSIYPSCLFINDTALPHSEFTASITIPVSVGPAGSYYQLTAAAWNSSGGTTWFFGTGWFDLTDATGAWSKDDLEGYLPYNRGNVPCGSLACVKACENQLDADDSDEYDIASLIVCLENCDNVPIADYLLDEVTAAALSSASASFAATHTATASAASVTATSATLTALSSGTASSSSGQPSATATSGGAAGIGAVSMFLIAVASCSTLRTFL